MAEMTEKTIQSIAQLARTTGDPKIIDGGNIPFAVIPQDSQVVSLEGYVYNERAERPQRVKQAVSVLDPDSFIEYYRLFSDENSRVFAYEPTISVTGVIDYHGALAGGSPRWCQHRLTLTLRESEEWKIWTGSNNKQRAQMEFAEFLEQNATDISAPSPASIVEVARDLEGKSEVEFGSGTRTQSGQIQFRYSEQIKATVGGGAVAVPEEFIVSIPVFIGGPRIPMRALLRYRVREGKLTLWYTLVRPEEVKRTAFLEARNKIADALKIAVINGTV